LGRIAENFIFFSHQSEKCQKPTKKQLHKLVLFSGSNPETAIALQTGKATSQNNRTEYNIMENNMIKLYCFVYFHLSNCLLLFIVCLLFIY